MIAKAVLLFCLVAAANSNIAGIRLTGYPTPIATYRHIPEVHEYVASPVVHKVLHPIHVQNVVQPVVHTVYKTPLLRHTVETPVLEPQPPVIAEPAIPVGSPAYLLKKKRHAQH